MSNQIDHHRREFISALALAYAIPSFAAAEPAQPKAANSTTASFAPLKRINAGALDVSYAEAGPANGKPVLLLHGWPYDIYSYVEVAPILAAAGYRVIIPYLRGYGGTRFLAADTPRNGQQAALAADGLALLDALKIERAVVAGYDWGARTANIMAALWPERCKGDANGAPHPDPKVYAKKFSGKYQHRLLTGGIGHNLPQEAPQAFAKAVIHADKF
jgi:dienelactone hydrolase